MCVLQIEQTGEWNRKNARNTILKSFSETEFEVLMLEREEYMIENMINCGFNKMVGIPAIEHLDGLELLWLQQNEINLSQNIFNDQNIHNMDEIEKLETILKQIK